MKEIFLIASPKGLIIAEIPVFALNAIPVLNSMALNLANSKYCLTPDEFCSHATLASIVKKRAPFKMNCLTISGLV